MMKILFYAATASLLFTSGLSYAESKQIPDFSGEWGGRYEGCEFNSTDWFKFKQKGRLVSGEWSASSIKAWSGKLKGKIIGDKLFVYYCYYPSDNSTPICPRYQNKAEDYFIIKKDRLIKYTSFGDRYEIDETAKYIYKIQHGGNLPIIKDNSCNTDQ